MDLSGFVFSQTAFTYNLVVDGQLINAALNSFEFGAPRSVGLHQKQKTAPDRYFVCLFEFCGFVTASASRRLITLIDFFLTFSLPSVIALTLLVLSTCYPVIDYTVEQ